MNESDKRTASAARMHGEPVQTYAGWVVVRSGCM